MVFLQSIGILFMPDEIFYIPVPDSFPYLKISNNAKLLYCILCRKAKHDGFARTKIARLCEEMRMSDKSIRRFLKELQKNDLIKIENQGPLSAHYFIKHPWFQARHKVFLSKNESNKNDSNGINIDNSFPERYKSPVTHDRSFSPDQNNPGHPRPETPVTHDRSTSLYKHILEHKNNNNFLDKNEEKIKEMIDDQNLDNSDIVEELYNTEITYGQWSRGRQHKCLYKNAPLEFKQNYLQELFLKKENLNMHIQWQEERKNYELKATLVKYLAVTDQQIEIVQNEIKFSLSQRQNFR